MDIDSDFYNINASKIEEKITSKTKAIIPVHLYGQPATMDKIISICKNYNLFLIEDCAQAHFAEWKNKRVGTFGIVGTFSFFPGKNLGAYGDAGAIITNDEEFAMKAKMFANHGALVKHRHQIEGINSRLDSLQAAVLSVKLPHIEDWNKSRYLNSKIYNKYLKNIDNLIIPEVHPNVKHILSFLR